MTALLQSLSTVETREITNPNKARTRIRDNPMQTICSGFIAPHNSIIGLKSCHFTTTKEIMKIYPPSVSLGVSSSLWWFLPWHLPCSIPYPSPVIHSKPLHSLSHVTSSLPFSFPVNHSHIHSHIINHSIPLVCTSMYRCGSFPSITTKHPLRLLHHFTHTSHILH